MQKTIWLMISLLMPVIGLGANDVCVHLNGGDDVAYIGELNTMEIWIANDVEVSTLQFAFEVCWPTTTTLWAWNMEYGSDPPFNRHGDAIGNLILFAHDETFDYASCETFVIGAAALMPSQHLPPASSRLCYSIQFGIVSSSAQADAIQVQPYAYFGSNDWYFTEAYASSFPPDFCGQPVPDMDDPVAPPVTFSTVYRTPSACGDSDCTGSVDIDDVVYLINYIFSGGSAPCDTDGDGAPDC